MAERNDSAGPDWGDVFPSVVDGWLFSDVPHQLPPTAVLPLENPDLYDSAVWEEKTEVEERYRSATIVRYRGTRLCVLSPKLGAPAAAMALEAAAARGVRTVLGLGYCGAISPELTCGDLLVPTGAVSRDGTTAAYCPDGYPAVADHGLVTALHRAATDPLHDGLVCSVDAVYTQDSALVEQCRRRRVAGLDMETSAVLTVARLRGVRAATVLVASDHPGSGALTEGAALARGTRRALDLALEVVTGDLS
ncbi:hypothetical protein [Streptomyces sp. NPDC002564]|uniref:phosphorylase family protein n=1 Tax=Streptomyces sp. NPDC002564 TaxID=3364649 RepID=UPI0036BBB188